MEGMVFLYASNPINVFAHALARVFGSMSSEFLEGSILACLMRLAGFSQGSALFQELEQYLVLISQLFELLFGFAQGRRCRIIYALLAFAISRFVGMRSLSVRLWRARRVRVACEAPAFRWCHLG